MNILILEDEIPAYQKLIVCLNVCFNEKITHQWARSIAEAKPILEQSTFNFILSDIQLLDGLSFSLFEETQTDTPIIFCSAHDDYLFDAFKTNGIAYILKPYTQLDFNKAIEKYQSLFNQGSYSKLSTKTLKTLKDALHTETDTYKTRFVIKKPTGIHLLSTNDISLISASGDFCLAIDGKGKQHIISQNLGSIYSKLNPKKFFKINRSEIINIDFINHIENHFKNRLVITLNNVKDKVTTSTSVTAEFRKWLE